MTARTWIILIAFSSPIILIFWWYLKRIVRQARHKKLMAAPFPVEWQTILNENLPPYAHLSPQQKKQLHGETQIFLNEITFEGAGGLEINDEIKVTIAAQACLLLLNRPKDSYPRLQTVIVYPHTYIAEGQGEYGGTSVRAGESWGLGVVVLAWDHVIGGAKNFDDGSNVTLHEFAHQLDQEDGSSDGAPILENLGAYTSWGKVLGGEYNALCNSGKKRRTVLDKYGTTNPAEFFAVATEAFFEKPRQLRKKHPELFEELQSYYHLDPQEWE